MYQSDISTLFSWDHLRKDYSHKNKNRNGYLGSNIFFSSQTLVDFHQDLSARQYVIVTRRLLTPSGCPATMKFSIVDDVKTTGKNRGREDADVR